MQRGKPKRSPLMNKHHCEAAKRTFYSFVWITEELLYIEDLTLRAAGKGTCFWGALAGNDAIM